MAQTVPTSCPRCHTSGTLGRVNGEGPSSWRCWKCSECQLNISQTETQILHCRSPRCQYDICHSCERRKFRVRPVLGPNQVEGRDGAVVDLQSLSLLNQIPFISRAEFVRRLEAETSGIRSAETASTAMTNLFQEDSIGFLNYFQSDCVSDYDAQGNFRRIHALDFSEGFAGILDLLTEAAKHLDAEAIMDPFPKKCPGCFMLNIICTVAVAPRCHTAATRLLRTMMGDTQGVIVEDGELLALSTEARANFKRPSSTGDTFPYMGNCLDFQHAFTKQMVALGNLLIATKVRALLEHDQARAIAMVTRYLTSVGTDPEALRELGAKAAH